jgi:hypothetical protein
MPLGISDSTLKAAYGPVDFSSFYKNIDAAAKRAADEFKLEKKYAMNEYLKLDSSLKTTATGVRDIDLTKINNSHQQWANNALALANNPNLFSSDTEKYKKLYGDSQMHLNNTQRLIKQSQETSAFLEKANQLVKAGKASEQGIALVNKISSTPTYKLLEEGGLPGLEDIAYTLPDLNKMSIQLDGELTKQAKVDNIRIKKADGKLPNTIVADVVSGVLHPNIAQNVINGFVDKTKDKVKVADNIMSTAISTGQVGRIFDQYNSIDDNQLVKYKTEDGKDLYPEHPGMDGKMTRKPNIPVPTGTSTADWKNYLLASQIVNNINKIKTTAQDKEFYPNGKEIVGLEVADAKAAKAHAWSKDFYLWKQDHPNTDNNLLNFTIGLFYNMNKGNVKTARAALSKVPNGFTNSIYKFGEPLSNENKDAVNTVAKKLGKTPDELNKMSADDIAKGLGVSQESVRNGVITTEGVASDNVTPAYKFFDNSADGQNEFLKYNMGAFGSKSKKGAQTNLLQTATGILDMGTATNEGKGKSKYSSTEEQMIQSAMKKNPGFSRQQIIDAAIKAGHLKK